MFRKVQDDVGAKTLTVYICGRSVTANEGETVAGVLLRHAPLLTRTTPVQGTQRAPYCMMGVCFDCLAVVDGVSSCQTCLTTVSDGMRIEKQDWRREVYVDPEKGLQFVAHEPENIDSSHVVQGSPK